MTTTARDIFETARALLDELTDDGTLIPDIDVIDLQKKAIRFINTSQRELYKQGEIFAEFEVAHTPYKNILGSMFKTEEHTDEDIIYEVDNAKSYCFEVDNGCTVYIEELDGAWEVINTITVPETIKGFTMFKGSIVSTNRVRIRFSGDYFFRVRNIALFTIPFREEDIPTYKPFVGIELPDNFASVSQVLTEQGSTQEVEKMYRWEGRRTLVLNYSFDGNLKITYKPIPTKITDIEDILEVDDLRAGIIPYYVASKLALYEKPDAVQYFESLYQEERRRLEMFEPTVEETIQDVMFGGEF